MKRPSLQFYPADWSGNANLKRCTFEEKGIWVDVMCLMHDQPEYGVLRWPLDEIAEAVKCKPTSLQAIARKNVIKGSDTAVQDFIYVPRSGRKDGDPVVLIPAQDGPIWYSSRMVTDEYVRNHAGASTRFGARQSTGSPDTTPRGGDSPSRAPSHRQGDTKPRQGERRGEDQGDGSSSSSSSSSLSEESLPSGAVQPGGTEPRCAASGSGDLGDDESVRHTAGANPKPEGAMAVALRNARVVVKSTDPILHQWLKDGITTERLLEAVSIARIRKPHEAIPAAYLDKIVRDTPAPASANGQQNRKLTRYEQMQEALKNA